MTGDETTNDNIDGNYNIFRDCISEFVIARLVPIKERRRAKGRKNEDALQTTNTRGTAEDLGDFIEV